MIKKILLFIDKYNEDKEIILLLREHILHVKICIAIEGKKEARHRRKKDLYSSLCMYKG